MSETLITCPGSGDRFVVVELLGEQVLFEIQASLKEYYQTRLYAAFEQARAAARGPVARELPEPREQIRCEDLK